MQWRVWKSQSPDKPCSGDSRWAPSKRLLWAPVAYLCLCAGNSIKSLNLSLFLEGRLEDKWPDRENLCHWLAKFHFIENCLLGRFSLYKFIVNLTCWSTALCLTERSVLVTCTLTGFYSVQTNFNCVAVEWSILGLRASLKVTVEIRIAFLSIILQFKGHLYFLLNLQELNYFLHRALIRHHR